MPGRTLKSLLHLGKVVGSARSGRVLRQGHRSRRLPPYRDCVRHQNMFQRPEFTTPHSALNMLTSASNWRLQPAQNICRMPGRFPRPAGSVLRGPSFPAGPTPSHSLGAAARVDRRELSAVASRVPTPPGHSEYETSAVYKYKVVQRGGPLIVRIERAVPDRHSHRRRFEFCRAFDFDERGSKLAKPEWPAAHMDTPFRST